MRVVSVIPALPLLSLSDDEDSLVQHLFNTRSMNLVELDILDAYYNGQQRIRDLGISTPPQMRGLRTVVGWPRIGIGALDDRCDVQGFRYANSADGDEELFNIWQANNLDEESQLVHLDAFIYGHAYAAAGVNDDGSALITVESARDMAVLWNARTRQIDAALRVYGTSAPNRLGGVQPLQGTLYLPDQNVSLVQSVNGWVVEERDEHRMGQVTVERFANRQRIHDRRGSSEITPEVMSVTDAACRTLLGVELARESYGSPQRYILGVEESAFQDAEGNPKTGWETYLGRILALERDQDGNVPTVGTFAQYDPSVYTRIIDMYKEEMAGLLSLPPYMLGKTTQNPASADAIRSAENGLIRKAERRQQAFSGSWENVMRLALRIQGNGRLPDEAKRIETMWASAATPTPAATTDAITKQVAAGIIPATSDVTREQLGYSVIERQRLAIDDKLHHGDELIAELSKSLIVKDARATNTVVKGLTPNAPTQPAAAPAVPPVK